MLQAPQTSGKGQHRQVPEAHPATAARSEAPQLCRGGRGGTGRTGRPASVQHEGRIIAAQEAPLSPGFLRSANGTSPSAPIPTSDSEGLAESSAATVDPLSTLPDEEDNHHAAIDNESVAELYVDRSPRKPTFLRKARWKAVQQAKLKGMSIRGMARELGIHRNTVRKYIDAESPPTRRAPTASTAAPSDTIADQTSDISAEHLDGHLS